MKMTRSQARDYIAGNPGLILQRDGAGTGYICPLCMSGAGEHGTGLVVQRDKRHFSCFGNGQCFKNKDIFDIIGFAYNLYSFPDKLKKAAELAGVELENDSNFPTAREVFGHPLDWNDTISRDPKPTGKPVSAEQLPPEALKAAEDQEPQQRDYIKAFHYWHSCIDQTDYWKRRGFTREIMSRFKIGFNPRYIVGKDKDGNNITWAALIVPVTAHAYAIRNTDPDAPHKDRHRKKGKAALYNPLKIDFSALDRAVFIVEGELDALSVIQSGGAAVAVRSTDNVPALIERLHRVELTECRYLFGLFDSDEHGQEARAQMENGLKDTRFIFTGYDLKEMHDPNDFLIKAPEEMKRFIADINEFVEREYKKI